MVDVMSTSADFLREIQSAASLMGIAPSTLCQRAVANGRLVKRLEEGKTVTVDTVSRIRSYIAAQSRPSRRRRAAPSRETAA